MKFKNILLNKIAEDIDTKYKVQKNKPAGLDSTSPKQLPEDARMTMENIKKTKNDLNRIDSTIKKMQAEFNAKVEEARKNNQYVEKQAQIQNYLNLIAKQLENTNGIVYQYEDKLLAYTHELKEPAPKITDKQLLAMIIEKFDKSGEMQQAIDQAKKESQQALPLVEEKTLTEFEPTQKQKKTSSIGNDLLTSLKSIYENLRDAYKELMEGTKATASKSKKLNKKAKDSYSHIFGTDIENIDIKKLKDYLKANSTPRSSFEELGAWTNSWLLELLNENNDNLEKAIDIIHKSFIDNNGNNMGSNAQESINIFDDSLRSIVSRGNMINKKLVSSVVKSMKKKAEFITEDDVLFQIFEDFELFTPDEIALCTSGWGKNLETAETMLYVRMGLRSLEQLKHELEEAGHDMSEYTLDK